MDVGQGKSMMSPADGSRSVCVVVAAMNAEKTIGRAVQSALAQPETAELMVVDDGSTDGTASRAEAANDGTGRLTVLRNSRNLGPAAARNRAIAASRSPIVTVLDSDDYWLPGRLGRLLAQMSDRDFVADDLFRVVEGQEHQALETLMGPRSELPRDLTLAQFVLANVSRPGRSRQELGFLKPLMRRAFLDGHGLAYDETVRLGEDFILYAQALARGGRFRLVAPCGYVAVERPTSLSGAHGAADLKALLVACEALDREVGLDRASRRALGEHGRHLRGKLHHRRVLDVRRACGLAAAIRALFEDLEAIPHVLSATLSDKINKVILQS